MTIEVTPIEEQEKFLRSVGWHTWHNTTDWVHPDLVQDKQEQNYCYYGLDLIEAFDSELCGRPFFKNTEHYVQWSSTRSYNKPLTVVDLVITVLLGIDQQIQSHEGYNGKKETSILHLGKRQQWVLGLYVLGSVDAQKSQSITDYKGYSIAWISRRNYTRIVE